MELNLTPHLTSDPRDKFARVTHKGQAHFAGTGPDGTTCRLCKFWREHGISHFYYSPNGKHGPTLKPHPCQQFARMTGGKGPAVPHGAASCKYFEQSDVEPPIYDPRIK